MRITKHWHSCLLIEQDETKILVDPGNYSFMPGRAKPEDFKDLTAILITHEHSDHADPEIIRAIRHKNPVPVYGNSGVKKALGHFGIEVQLAEEKIFHIGRLQIEAMEAEHEPLLKDVPQNTAYLIDNALVLTGDSYDSSMYKFKNSRALALPILSPWGRVKDAHTFLKKTAPRFAFPVHDGFVIEKALQRQHAAWQEACKELGIDFRPMEGPDISLEV